MGCHVVVMRCGCAMWLGVVGRCGELVDDALWGGVESLCHSKTLETLIPMHGKVLPPTTKPAQQKLQWTTKSYSVIQRTTPYNYVLHRTTKNHGRTITCAHWNWIIAPMDHLRTYWIVVVGGRWEHSCLACLHWEHQS